MILLKVMGGQSWSWIAVFLGILLATVAGAAAIGYFRSRRYYYAVWTVVFWLIVFDLVEGYQLGQALDSVAVLIAGAADNLWYRRHKPRAAGRVGGLVRATRVVVLVGAASAVPGLASILFGKTFPFGYWILPASAACAAVVGVWLENRGAAWRGVALFGLIAAFWQMDYGPLHYPMVMLLVAFGVMMVAASLLGPAASLAPRAAREAPVESPPTASDEDTVAARVGPTSAST